MFFCHTSADASYHVLRNRGFWARSKTGRGWMRESQIEKLLCKGSKTKNSSLRVKTEGSLCVNLHCNILLLTFVYTEFANKYTIFYLWYFTCPNFNSKMYALQLHPISINEKQSWSRPAQIVIGVFNMFLYANPTIQLLHIGVVVVNQISLWWFRVVKQHVETVGLFPHGGSCIAAVRFLWCPKWAEAMLNMK